MSIYFFRLVTGDNIFGQYDVDWPSTSAHRINNPLILETLDDGHTQYMMMVRYAPSLKQRELYIPCTHVVHFGEVSPLMSEYYTLALEQCAAAVDQKFDEGIGNAVDQIKKLLASRDKGDEPAAVDETTDFKERVVLSQLAKLTDTKN